ncbi:MAG TPA: hypothetical protein DCS81_13045 [Pantoea septica]|nr:hypothetical protein [Pantoea septica]
MAVIVIFVSIKATKCSIKAAAACAAGKGRVAIKRRESRHFNDFYPVSEFFQNFPGTLPKKLMS